MPTNRLPKRGIVDSLIFLNEQFKRIQRELCCSSGGGGTGTVTSVGVTMPTAFTVSGSPITTTGTIDITGSGTTSQYIRGDGTLATLDKTAVGLSNVDNTADTAKPVSTVQQTALNLKANSASPTFTGTPLSTTATAGTNTTQIATTAFVTTAITNKTISLQQATTTGNTSTNELLITNKLLANTAKGLHIAFDPVANKSSFTNIDVAANTNTTIISLDLHNIEFFTQTGYRLLGLNDQQSGSQALANFNGRVKIEDGFLDNEASSLSQLKFFAANSGVTASRPSSPITGQSYFDTTLSPAKPIWYNGTIWVDSTGVAA